MPQLRGSEVLLFVFLSGEWEMSAALPYSTAMFGNNDIGPLWFQHCTRLTWTVMLLLVAVFFDFGGQQTRALPHAGLGVPAYVQFTSPIRRFGDLVSGLNLV